MSNKRFSSAFQTKTIASLLLDKSFLIQVHDILTPDIFENKAREFLLEEIIKYYNKYQDIPSADALTNIVTNIQDKTLSELVIIELNNVIKYSISKDLMFVKDEVISFCKDQEIKKAIYESVNLIKAERYDEIRKVIDKALKAGQTYNLGLNYFKDVDERYEKSARSIIPTPWTIINEIIDGGVGKGELITFVSSPGGGKSWMLVNIGHAAVLDKKRVIHYTLELNQNYTGLRYDSKFTGIPFQDLKYNVEEVKRNLKKYTNDNLIIKDFPTKSINVSGLRSHLQNLIINDQYPDMIIIDYADLLKSNNNLSKYDSIEEVYEQLRGLAGELNVPVITASQSNRSSGDSDFISGESISDAYAKVMIADVVISLSRKSEDKANGTGRIHFIKNRFGPDGITFPSKINMAIGDIQIFTNDSDDGKTLMKSMGSEGERKLLSQKYDEMNINKNKMVSY